MKIEEPHQGLFSMACFAKFFRDIRPQKAGGAVVPVSAVYAFCCIQTQLADIMTGCAYNCSIVRRVPALCKEKNSVSFTATFFEKSTAEKCTWMQPKVRDTEESLKV